MLAYGAHVIPVAGSYDDAFELCAAACRRFGWYNRSTALNPFTIEGKKTAALEIASALADGIPDAVLVPTGDGVILGGLAKGFRDLERAQLVEGRPRLIAVQPEGSAAIVRALEGGKSAGAHHPQAASIADSLVVETPRNAIHCLAEIRASGGGGLEVTDEAIVQAIARLARLTGVFAEPAAAAALCGLESAIDRGLVDRNERVVLMISGSGLKDAESAARAVSRPAPIEPTIEALERRLGDA
jgi:threonine synthase